MSGKLDLYAFGLKPLYNFDQFVVGPNNQFAVSACQAVAKSLGDTYNPLFVYGPPGVGKTHAVQAVAQEVLKQNPNLKVRYVSAERLMSEVIAAISDDNVLTARQHFSDLNLLIVDDVQYLTQSQSSQEELSHIFNNMQAAGRQLILACDRPPNQLSGLNKTLRSRLEGGLATDVKMPDINMRIEILRRKGQTQSIDIPEELLVYVAQRLRSNVRELEGFLKRMHAYVTLSHQEITPQLVQSVVREVLPEGMADLPPDQMETPTDSAPVQIASVAKSAPPPAPAPVAVRAPVPEPVIEPIEEVAPPPPPPPVPVVEIKKNGATKKKPPLEEIPVVTPEPVVESPRPAPPPPPPPTPPSPAPVPMRGVEILSNQSMAQSANTTERVAPKVPVQAPVAKVPVAAVKPVLPPEPVKKMEPPKPPPPAPPPAPEPVVEEVPVEEDGPNALKEISAVFFYPYGAEKILENVHTKFLDVIKKHKLKFRLKRVHSEMYQPQGKTNYSSFVEICKKNKVPVAVVIGPPPEAHVPEQDFYDLLSVTLDVQGVSLQLINWAETDKDYRYLNLALDIALVRTR